MNPLMEPFLSLFDRMSEGSDQLPEMASRFDRTNLILQEDVDTALVAIGGAPSTGGDIARWSEQRWFSWHTAPGEDGEARFGIPTYVLERLKLFQELSANGWTDAELGQYAEYEEDIIQSVLCVDDVVPMPKASDQYLAAAKVYVALLIETNERAAGYEGSSGHPPTDEPRSENIERWKRWLTVLNTRGWQGFKPEFTNWLRRETFGKAMWDELCCTGMLEAERAPLRDGISWFVALHSGGIGYGAYVFGANGDTPLKDTIAANWEAVLACPETDDGGHPLPVRLPGLVLRNDTITLVNPVAPALYADLWRRWDLDSYFRIQAELTGQRRCAHCHQPILSGPETKRYCARECRDASKQAQYRARLQARRDASRDQ